MLRRAAGAANRGSSTSVGQAQCVAQPAPMRILDRRDLDPAFLRLVQAVQGTRAGLGLVEPGPRHPFAVYEQRVGREHRAAVEQRSPQLLAFTGDARWYSAARHPTTESIALAVSVIPKR